MFNEELMEASAESMIKNGLVMGRVVYPTPELVDALVSTVGESNPFWYGDINPSTDMTLLKRVAREIKTDLTVMSEHSKVVLTVTQD